MQMLCRNRVTDFEVWWTVFESHKADHQAAGLHLETLWQGADDPNEVFFLFRVDDRNKAQEFLDAPASAQAGKDAGVLDGEYFFVEEASGD